MTHVPSVPYSPSSSVAVFYYPFCRTSEHFCRGSQRPLAHIWTVVVYPAGFEVLLFSPCGNGAARSVVTTLVSDVLLPTSTLRKDQPKWYCGHSAHRCGYVQT